MMKQSAFRFVDEHHEEMLNEWQELVQIDSGTLNKAGVDSVGARIRQFLEAERATIRTIEFEAVGNLLIGEIGKERPRPGVVLMGHMDTVFKAGTTLERPFTIRQGNAYGPGALDMKGGIVTILYAIKALNAAGYDTRPIKILLAGDEENGHKKSNAANCLIDEAKGHAAAFNCETGYVDNGIVVGRKGMASITIEVKGVAAHAGNDPENGRNAIVELATKIVPIQNLTNRESGVLVNVGVIQGGTVENAVPDFAKMIVDVRYSELEQIKDILRKIEEIGAQTYIQGTTTTVSLALGIAPMKTDDGVMELFSVVKKTYEENGWGTPYPKTVGGGADSAYSVMAGVPTVCAMGVKGGRNHSPDEFAVVESLFERTKLLVGCILNLDECLSTNQAKS
ncbi:MAG: M20 family metallopeptidase [Betaproteobacteria bacterium]